MLENIKILLGDKRINYPDGLLQLMLNMAEAEILDYTRRTELDAALESVVIQLVLARLNKMGAEGLESQSYSGVSESYLTDMPSDLLRVLNSKRRIRVVY